jgi:hypothetical protein
MLWLLRATLKEAVEMKYFKAGAIDLCTWIIGMKIVKVMPHFKKNPKDIVYLPAYLGYGYLAHACQGMGATNVLERVVGDRKN